jgi:hypothetical protein
MTGRYDLTDLIDALLNRLGAALHLRVATLSFNDRNLRRLTAWTNSRAVETLSLLASRFFTHHYPELWEQVLQALGRPTMPPPAATIAKWFASSWPRAINSRWKGAPTCGRTATASSFVW